MSMHRNATKKPGFGKRGSVRVTQVERKPAASGRLARMFDRWWITKPTKKMAKKGFGFRRTEQGT